MHKLRSFVSVLWDRLLLILGIIQIGFGIVWTILSFDAGFDNAFGVFAAILLACFANLLLIYQMNRATGLIPSDVKKTAVSEVLCALITVTFPICLQVHVKNRFYSPVSSLVLIIAAIGIAVVRQKKNAFLRIAVLLVCLAMCGGLLFTIHPYPGRSNAETAFDRTVWTSLIHREENWPGELTEVVGEEIMTLSVYACDNMELLLKPAVREALGEDGAEALFAQMARLAWRSDKSTILKECIYDAAGYILPPVMLGRYLDGYGYGSYNVANYDRMRRSAPGFTRYYVDFGILYFVLLLVSFVIKLIHNLIRSIKARKAKAESSPNCSVFVYLLLGLMVCLITAFGVSLGSARQDYRLAIAVTSIWICGGLMKAFPEELE